MKKLITLMLCLASYGAILAAGPTNTTVYFAVNTDYTMKVYIKYGTGTGDGTNLIEMTKTSKTFKGIPIYSANFDDKWSGLASLWFQAFDGETFQWEDKQFSDSWKDVSSYNGKMHVQNTTANSWIAYTYDRTAVIHCKKGDSWTPTNAYAFYLDGNDDMSYDETNASWAGEAVTQNTLNADYYDISFTNKTYNNIIFNNGTDGVGTNQTYDIALGDASEYWITDGAASTTATSSVPLDFTYTRSELSDGKFGTICLPYGVTAVSGAKVYKIASKVMSGANVAGVNLTEVNSLEAGKPYIFQAEGSSFTATLSGTYTDATPDFGMVGNLSSTPATVTVDADYYVIQENKMKKVVSGGTVTCGQYRAYITLEGIAEAPASARGTLFLGLDDESTGIENIQVEQNQNVTYNLQGQRVKDGQKGLLIVNGKKFIRK